MTTGEESSSYAAFFSRYHLSYFPNPDQTLQVTYFSLNYHNIILKRMMFLLLIQSCDLEAFLLQVGHKRLTEIPT